MLLVTLTVMTEPMLTTMLTLFVKNVIKPNVLKK